MAPTWAVPVGVLAGLAVLALIFVCIWFPRTYKKGVAHDMKDLEQARPVVVDDDGNAVGRAKITFEVALERARADIRAGKGKDGSTQVVF